MPSKRSPTRLVLLLVVLAVVSVVGALLLRWGRQRHNQRLAAREVERIQRGPKVFVAPVLTTSEFKNVTLPAEARAFVQATLYGKVAGYVKTMRVDKGDAVKANQLLAVIESPETDRLVAADRSDLVVKEQFLTRVQKLMPEHWFSDQDLANALAAVNISRAVLERDSAFQGYEQVRAPYDGMITGRYTDPGALIPAATGATAGAMPIVDITDIRKLRIALFVAQDVAPFVNAQTTTSILVDERPELKIEAPVTRVAGALDPRSRTMLTEIWLNNAEYGIQPGSFLHVTLHVKVPPLPTIPSESLFVRNQFNMAAVVRDDKLAFVRVVPGLDDGTRVQIESGLKPGEVVAVNVPVELLEGAQIQPVPQPAPKKQGQP